MAFVRSNLRAAACVLCCLVILASAQQTPTYTSNVKVVNVLATVRDGHGKIVNSLAKDDFTLAEDGRPQTIKYFSRETDLPLTLGLLVDTSRSLSRELESEKHASAAFANDVLREGKDSAFLIHFDRDVEMLRDVTSSRQKFVTALDEIQTSGPDDSQRSDPNSDPNDRRGGPGSSRGGRGFNAGTLLYDAVYLASDEVLTKQQGRKAIILLTDGVDHGSKMSLDQAIETAQRSDTIVYALYYEGEERSRMRGSDGQRGGRHGGGGYPGGIGGGWPGGGRSGGGGGRQGGGGYPGGGGRDRRGESADGKKVLERLTRETGGRMFVVSKKETIEQVYSQIQDELRNQYNLGYTPDRNGDDAPDYRHITVTTKPKDMKVQTREGYYASRQLDDKSAKPGQ